MIFWLSIALFSVVFMALALVGMAYDRYLDRTGVPLFEQKKAAWTPPPRAAGLKTAEKKIS